MKLSNRRRIAWRNRERDEEDRNIEQLDAETGAVLARWSSGSAADRGLGFSKDTVGRALRGAQHLAGGFRWRYSSSRHDDDDDDGNGVESMFPHVGLRASIMAPLRKRRRATAAAWQPPKAPPPAPERPRAAERLAWACCTDCGAWRRLAHGARVPEGDEEWRCAEARPGCSCGAPPDAPSSGEEAAPVGGASSSSDSCASSAEAAAAKRPAAKRPRDTAAAEREREPLWERARSPSSSSSLPPPQLTIGQQVDASYAGGARYFPGMFIHALASRRDTAEGCDDDDGGGGGGGVDNDEEEGDDDARERGGAPVPPDARGCVPMEPVALARALARLRGVRRGDPGDQGARLLRDPPPVLPHRRLRAARSAQRELDSAVVLLVHHLEVRRGGGPFFGRKSLGARGSVTPLCGVHR